MPMMTFLATNKPNISEDWEAIVILIGFIAVMASFIWMIVEIVKNR